jgi:hypothetical protein
MTRPADLGADFEDFAPLVAFFAGFFLAVLAFLAGAFFAFATFFTLLAGLTDFFDFADFVALIGMGHILPISCSMRKSVLVGRDKTSPLHSIAHCPSPSAKKLPTTSLGLLKTRLFRLEH